MWRYIWRKDNIRAMDFSEASLIAFFTQYAYEPLKVYGLIIFFMLACAVVLPFPEELILLIAGLVAHSARNPELYPPPYAGAEGVNTITMCVVCYLAVFTSDLLVYFMGKFFGGRIIRTNLFQKRFAGEKFTRMNDWFHRYGGVASGFFRFTPGLRFPGHLTCGFLGIPLWKFVLVDALACLVFVPPQIYLIAVYGDVILSTVGQLKDYALYVVLAIVALFIAKKLYTKKFSTSN